MLKFLQNLSFHRIAYAVLGVAVLGLVIYVKMLENAVQRSTDSAYVLPANLSSRYKYKNNILTIYKRDKNGSTVVDHTYIPPEGNVDVKVSSSTHNVDFDIKNKGFTVRPGFGGIYDRNALLLQGDVKLAYWSRFSAGAGLTTRSLNYWVSYHLDQLPYWHPQNVEFLLGRSIIRFDNNVNQLNAGFRMNF